MLEILLQLSQSMCLENPCVSKYRLPLLKIGHASRMYTAADITLYVIVRHAVCESHMSIA
jgi:hypothetical protein